MSKKKENWKQQSNRNQDAGVIRKRKEENEWLLIFFGTDIKMHPTLKLTIAYIISITTYNSNHQIPKSKFHFSLFLTKSPKVAFK